MTKQEIFDKVWDWFVVKKNPRSIITKPRSGMNVPTCAPTCAYRGDDGGKCAFGVLIEDDEYSVEMEGKMVSDVLIGYPDLRAKFEENEFFIAALQRIHDGYSRSSTDPKDFTSYMRILLTRVADRSDLTIPL